jgi:hypothetical protein
MRRFLTLVTCLSVLCFAASAHAGALSQLYLTGDENVIEDNDWENFVDANPNGTANFIDVGDIAYGIYETTRVSNVQTGQFHPLGQAPLPGSFAGVFLLQATAVFAPTDAGNPTPGSYFIAWGPAPGAAWNTNFGFTPNSAGTVAVVYDDTSTPIVDPGNAGGLVPAIASAIDGTPLWEFGFAGGANEQWNSISNLNSFGTGLTALTWLANLNATHTFAAANSVTLHLTNRFFDLADDGIANGSSNVWGQLQVDGQIDLAISTPEALNWNIKSDTDFVIRPTPEPGSLVLLGLGLIGGGVAVYRRRRKV